VILSSLPAGGQHPRLGAAEEEKNKPDKQGAENPAAGCRKPARRLGRCPLGRALERGSLLPLSSPAACFRQRLEQARAAKAAASCRTPKRFAAATFSEPSP